MKLFSDIVESIEVKKSGSTNIILDKDDIDNYLDVVSKQLSKEAIILLSYFQTYKLLDKNTIEEIDSVPVNIVVKQYNIPIDVAKDIKKLLGKVELRSLPMFQTPEELRAILSKKISVEDVCIDLETDRGRNKVAKKFSNMVYAIANKYKGSGLDFDALISAGMMGLSKAMNDYHKPSDFIDADKTLTLADKEKLKKSKVGSFSGYAYTRISQQILNDLNDYSRTVRINQYQYEKNAKEGNTKGNFNTVSIDVGRDSEDGNTSILDRMVELSHKPDVGRTNYSDDHWRQIFDIIDKRFSTRTAGIFYRYMGLNGYEKTKAVDLAKELGVSGSAISMSVKDVIKFLKNDKKAYRILSEIMDIYSESLISDNFGKSKEQILEVLASDDVYILLSEITKWNNKKVFDNTIGNAMEDMNVDEREFLIECLEKDFNFIDLNYNTNKKTIVHFLESIYPIESFKRKTDVEILNRMLDLSEAFKTHYSNI